MKKIFVVGSLNMDLVIRVAKMPRAGETITGEGFMTNSGGKGANQAVAVAKLGGNAYMVGCVGREFGAELKGALDGYGVNTDYVRRLDDVSSGIAVITVENGDNRIILDRGANGRIYRELIDEALSVASAGDYLMLQLEISLDMVEYALKKGREKGMITMLNPAPAAALTEETFGLCDYFTPNQSEAEFYTGVYPSDEQSAEKCAEILAGKGVKNLVVTMGSEGSASVCDGVFRKVAANKVKAVDTTAAGDTYVGALAVKLGEGAGIEEAMIFAGKASAITVTRKGAQQAVPLRSEIE